MKNPNIFDIPEDIKQEYFETLFKGDGEFKIERIVSTGQVTPENEWYDQEKDEFVILIQGESKLLFLDKNSSEKIVEIKKGDNIFIKAHEKHRVIYTSSDPPCIWIAIHGNISKN